MTTRARVLLSIVGALAVFPLLAGEMEDLPGENATFSYSRAPRSVVLFVHARAVQTGAERSVTVYGDGRVEVTLKNSRSGGAPHRTYHLSEEEVASVLRTAVDYGLAEWDETHIQAEILKRTLGGGYSVSDGETVHVLLALRDYRNGDFASEEVSKSIWINSPQAVVMRFPDVPEFQGLLRVREFLSDSLNRRDGAER